MKFREYVGEDNVEEIQRVVKKTKKIVDFAVKKPVEVKKNIPQFETYLGYGLNKKSLKRVFDYIRSWFFRYDIPFDAPNPYLTLYLLNNVEKQSALVRKIKKEKRGKIYKPLGTLTVISNNHKEFPRRIQIEPDEGRDYIVLDYIPNLEYGHFLESVFVELGIDIIFRFCYVKLFEIEAGVVDGGFFEDLMYHCPPLPNLKLGNIGLIRS